MSKQLLDLWRDLVYALRILAKSRGFTAVGILSLTLGIGVCSVFYSELNALVFRPPPATRAAEALVALESLSSCPYFERYRDQPALVSAAAFVGPVPFSLTLDASTGARSARIFGHLVSPEYFTTLGMEPAMGRFFRPELEKEGTAPVAVISDRLWRAKFNSDRNVISRALRLNGKTVMVIGVAPRHFLGVFPIAPADVFVPVTSGASVAPELGGGALHRRDLAMFRVGGTACPGNCPDGGRSCTGCRQASSRRGGQRSGKRAKGSRSALALGERHDAYAGRAEGDDLQLHGRADGAHPLVSVHQPGQSPPGACKP